MRSEQDFKAEPLLNKAKDTEPEDTHHPLARIIFYIAVLLVIVVAFYALIYSIVNTFEQEATVSSVCLTAVGGWDSVNSDLAVFRGIPYAQAPVGELRWQPAQSRPCNGETIQAQQDANICLQPRSTPNSIQNEDCLYLNLYTRSLWKTDKDMFPILVWVYGGGNLAGSLSSYSQLSNWAIHGDVCVVAFNYRLNLFGFLTLKELSESDFRGNVSGNYGITDLIAALQWIQTNGKAFGCDPTKVTVMGHSSGATNILALLTAPSAKGLFHRAISLSGSPNITMDLHTTERQNIDIIDVLGCTDSADIATCLRSVPASTLLANIPSSWLDQSFWPTDPSGLNLAGLVIVDGVTVTMSLTNSLNNVLYDVPLLITSMRDEDDLFANDYTNITNLAITDYNTYLQNNFQPWENTNTGTEIANSYLPVTQQSVQESYFDLRSDIGLTCANIEIGTTAALHYGSPVYIGIFMQGPKNGIQSTPPPDQPLTLPFHGWDYIVSTFAWDFFTTYPGHNTGSSYNPTPEDIALGLVIQKSFYDFISTGVASDLFTINKIENGENGSFPLNYTVINFGDSNYSSLIKNEMNFKSETCELLKNLDLNPDSRFWWVN